MLIALAAGNAADVDCVFDASDIVAAPSSFFAQAADVNTSAAKTATDCFMGKSAPFEWSAIMQAWGRDVQAARSPLMGTQASSWRNRGQRADRVVSVAAVPIALR